MGRAYRHHIGKQFPKLKPILQESCSRQAPGSRAPSRARGLGSRIGGRDPHPDTPTSPCPFSCNSKDIVCRESPHLDTNFGAWDNFIISTRLRCRSRKSSDAERVGRGTSSTTGKTARTKSEAQKHPGLPQRKEVALKANYVLRSVQELCHTVSKTLELAAKQ